MATLTTSYQELGSASLFTVTSGGNTYTGYLKLDGKYTAQSTTNNTTTVKFRLRVACSLSGANFKNDSGSAAFTGAYTDSKSIAGTRYYAGDTIYEIEKTVTHSSDGTKSLSIGGKVTGYHDATISNKSVTLPTINRYPKIASAPYLCACCPINAFNDGTISTDTTALTKFNVYPKIATAPNFTDEDNPTMTWTRYNSNFWQRAKMEVGGDYSFIVRDVSKTASSCTFTLTDEEIDKLLDAAGDNDTLPVRFTICAMSVEHGTEANELSASYLDRTMTVTPKGKIGKDGQWKRVQIYFGDGTWKRCTPYIGKSGTWKRVK